MAYTTGVILGPISLNISGSSATNIGTGSYSGTVTLGNASATALNLIAPTNINVAGALSTAIGSTSNTGTVAIGNTNSTSVTIIGPVNINTSSTNNTAIGSTSNSGTISIGNTSSGLVSIGCGTAGINIGTTANAHATTVGSTTASATTVIQAPSGGVSLIGVQGVAVANKNYVTINTSTGAIGSDSGPSSSISITGNTGGALTGNAFTFTGGTTGLVFNGAGTTETLGGTLVVSNGGTGVATMTTAYAPVCAGTTATGALQVASTGLSTSGYVLTSNGSSALPSFQAASGGPGTNIFLAFMNADQTNITGEGTQATVIFNATQSNPGSYYNTSTGVFTAPATGNYLFNVAIAAQGSSAGANRLIALAETTSIEYKLVDENFLLATASGQQYVNASFMTRLSATDTCFIQLRILGGATKTCGVSGSNGAAQYVSFFSGYYVSA